MYVNWRAVRVGVAIGLVMLFLVAEASAFSCGIKPIIPVECSDAVCICDDDGCRWVFICD